MNATWQNQRYTVTCPRCSNERIVSRVQYWRLNNGLRKECKSCSVTGRVYPGRAGIGFSPQAKEAQRKAVIGNKFAVGTQYTEVERKRRSKLMMGNKRNPGLRGEANPSWKGGIGTERHRAMGQIEYKEWRKAVFTRDNHTCQTCKAANIYLHADHVIEWSKDKALRYDVSNGLTLCYECHYKKTFGKLNEDKALLWGVPAKHRKVIRN